MSWSAHEAREWRKRALRFLLDASSPDFRRSTHWSEQAASGVPAGVWSILLQEKLILGHVVGGPKWRLTVSGWIEACKLLRDEIGLDARFGILSAHLKRLGGRVGADSHTQDIARDTGLSEEWVYDAIEGQMAERIYNQHGPKLIDKMGGLEIPAHIGNKFR